MNQGTNVLDYLTNNVSKDLELHYGYYAVRNRTNKEIKELTIQEGFFVKWNILVIIQFIVQKNFQ